LLNVYFGTVKTDKIFLPFIAFALVDFGVIVDVVVAVAVAVVTNLM
jgi:hypothetical protein